MLIVLGFAICACPNDDHLADISKMIRRGLSNMSSCSDLLGCPSYPADEPAHVSGNPEL
jgi:hypothetical protein